MRPSVLLGALPFFAASVCAQSTPDLLPVVSMISSQIPSQCSPGKSIGVSIDADKIATSLSEVQFQSLGHGRTGGSADCFFEVELNDWYFNYRVAISNATIKGNANLGDGVTISQFNATAVFRLEHHTKNASATPPEVTDLSLSTMLGGLATPNGIGGEGIFNDDFEVPISAASDVWSPCFRGSEGSGDDSTFIEFYVSALASGEGDARLSSGLNIDWSLKWEACTPDSSSTYLGWGDQRIEDWEMCTVK
ncbi:hypothetical protein GGR53DRAFT_514967 [Hypoxylon sp. FL1150]|nr:hypothetical protein GGR53DRAFT_514967 [Hypoxylon sp. FL1150]